MLRLLDDLSFTVREDQMVGFVGPNGAGRTTAMRIVLGNLSPTGARSAGAAGGFAVSGVTSDLFKERGQTGQ